MNVRCGNIRNKDGNLLTKDTDILSRWYECGSGLTMRLLRQMRIFWSSFGQIVREMCMNQTSSRAKLEQPSPRSNPGKLLVSKEN